MKLSTMDIIKRALCAAVICCLCALPCAGTAERDGAEFKILTSFYPVYLLTVNVAGDIDGVSVSNMAEQNVGCLHDYALRTGDVRMIHAADVVVVNGGGMESFIDKILTDMQKPIIDSSEGIEMIADSHFHGHGGHDAHEEEHDEGETEAHEEDHDHAEGETEDHAEDHDHAEGETDAHDGGHSAAPHAIGEVNAHFWMSPRQAIKQVRNIANGLMAADPAHGAQYEKNADAYIARLKSLDEQLTELLSGIQGANIVTSHPAFEYLARDYGINIVASLGQEPGEMPRTRDMAELVDAVREMNIGAVFVEKAYNETAAQVLSRETGIAIYTLDSLTSGDMDIGAYERGILSDAMILKEALSGEDT